MGNANGNRRNGGFSIIFQMDLTKKEIEFLFESNAIEREYSDEALEDAIKSWKYAKKQKGHINKKIILGIHKNLMKRTWKEIAGKIRKERVGVMTNEGFKEAISWRKIQDELNLLCNPGVYPTLSESLIKRWHIQFEHIHPFRDGNGRTGRIIMNIQRLNQGLPLLIIYNKEKSKYYKWFKEVKK